MTGEKKMFTSYVKNKDSQDSIIFGDGNRGKVKGLGKIAISSEHSISNVFLVESLEYNLLSVSQLCNMGYNCLFTNVDVSVFRRSDGSLAFKGVLDGKLYLVDFSKEEADLDACLIAKTRGGRSGYPKFSGRVIRVFKISGFENRYPKLQRVFQYPKIRVSGISGSGSGIPELPELLCWLHKNTYTLLN
jgi:hypothetical protein